MQTTEVFRYSHKQSFWEIILKRVFNILPWNVKNSLLGHLKSTLNKTFDVIELGAHTCGLLNSSIMTLLIHFSFELNQKWHQRGKMSDFEQC